MSRITYSTLQWSGNARFLVKVNDEVRKIDPVRSQSFGFLENVTFAGGSKLFTYDVAMAAFNHLPPNEIAKAVKVVYERYVDPFWVYLMCIEEEGPPYIYYSDGNRFRRMMNG